MDKIDAIRKIVSECPDIVMLEEAVKLSEDNINIDWTNKEPDSYGVMIYGEEETTTIEWIGGEKTEISKFNTALFMRLFTETQVNLMQNTKFLEKFTKYIRKVNNEKKFPLLSENETIEKIAATQGQVYDIGEEESGLYSIQITLTYETKYKPTIRSIFYAAEQ